ncbi:hypothetical protein ERJ75_000895800 [Trypanosoma vivax]|nr:hypothetical protein ERJ75_000895800 [Trypanosoma vivax]
MLGKALLYLAAAFACASGARVAEAGAAKGIKRGSAQGACALAKVLDGAGTQQSQRPRQQRRRRNSRQHGSRRQLTRHGDRESRTADSEGHRRQGTGNNEGGGLGRRGGSAARRGSEHVVRAHRDNNRGTRLDKRQRGNSGKLCIDRDGTDEATAADTQDTQYAGQLCDTVNLTANIREELISNDMDLDAAIDKAAKAAVGMMAIMTTLCWAPYCRARKNRRHLNAGTNERGAHYRG